MENLNESMGKVVYKALLPMMVNGRGADDLARLTQYLKEVGLCQTANVMQAIRDELLRAAGRGPENVTC